MEGCPGTNFPARCLGAKVSSAYVLNPASQHWRSADANCSLLVSHLLILIHVAKGLRSGSPSCLILFRQALPASKNLMSFGKVPRSAHLTQAQLPSLPMSILMDPLFTSEWISSDSIRHGRDHPAQNGFACQSCVPMPPNTQDAACVSMPASY